MRFSGRGQQTGGRRLAAFAAQWLMDGPVLARGRRAWACARRSVAGIGLPVSERGERRESSSASPAALACASSDGGAAGRGLSGVFRRPGFPTMHRADGGRVTAAIPGTGGRTGALARSGRHAVAGLLLAFAALLALHLQAQAQTTYVSNLNQTGTDTGLDAMHGQSFTTGDQAGDYQLGSVAVRMHYLAPGTTMAVSVYNTDTNGYPTTLKYALAAPSTIPSASTVYFSAPTGATLDAGTTYSVVFDVSATTFFYVTASDAEGTAEAGWSIADVVAQKTNSVWADRLYAQFSVQLAIIGPTSSNSAPIFTEGDSTSRETVESLNNTRDITARNIGTPVAATDPDTTDTLEYSLEGDDADKFEIVTNTGLITTKIGERYDYETKTSYSVRVKVVDGNGGSDTIDVTLNFLDQEEPPPVVRRPTVAATQGSTTSLDVSWPAPANIGRPEITSYDVQYKRSQDSTWTDGPQDVTTTSTSIGGLGTDASYDVQVRATNADGDSRLWSQLGTGRTGSTDATLSFLRLHVTSTGMPIALNETFASTLKEYTADVANAVTLITIVPTTSDSGATVAYLNASDTPLTDEDENWPNFQVAQAAGANTIKLKVTAHDRHTTDTYTLTVTRVVTTPPVTRPPVTEAINASATGKPEVSDTTEVGQTLAANTGDIEDPDGKTKAENGDAGYAYTYQWIRVDGATETPIPGATSKTYTVVQADAGKMFKVKVSFKDDAGNSEGPLTSKPTEAINAPATGKPKISDAAEVGQTLTANTGDIEDPDGKTKAENGDAGYAYTYQWIRVDGATETPIPGATSKTYTVVQADAGKMFKVKVSFKDDAGNSEGPLTSNEYIVGVVAAGTITDTIPKAWIARFGRTVADQALDAVDARLRVARTAGMSVSLGGQQIGGAAPKAESEEKSSAASDGKSASLFGETAAADAGDTARLKALSDWLSRETAAEDQSSGWSRTLRGRELLMGSSFSLAAQTDGGGFAAFWGRMAQTRFAGREGSLRLGGDVTTGVLGADYASGRWTTGLVVSHSIGEGDYRGENSGEIEATQTALTPWAGYAVTDRLSVWGTVGYGAGDLTLTAGDDPALKTDLGMMLGAAGARGTLIGGGGPKLDAVTDARWVRTTTARVSSSAGNLAAASAEVTRLRLGLVGSWPLALEDVAFGKGATVTPRMALGVRHDGGDAETGFGGDIGGGVTIEAPARGLTVSLDGRGVLTHEAAGLRDRGLAGSLAWDPSPSTGRGPKLTLRQTIGAGGSSRKNALLSRTTLEGLAANDNGDGRRRFEARFGYGFGMFEGQFTGTPEIRLGLSEAGRDYSPGWRLTRAGSGAGSLEFSLEARRRESANDDVPPEHGIGFRATARW